MSAKAAKLLTKFPELVLTGVDTRGFPFSVRQPNRYPADGVLPLDIPAALEPAPGPANLLGHTHDENLWGMEMVQVKGQIEAREGRWVFVTGPFEPPADLKRMLGASKRARAYLDKRGLPWPTVNYAGIDRMWKEAAEVVGRRRGPG